ncbi:hypothetical protein M0R04_04230 [Candidatus Dojkabacteria bacterium]|jgi:hypothetical protein|nr:hypothetical protein [Candidatus Dojkabacteria bacterium]
MEVYIGKYKNFWGPYQIADLLQNIGVNEDRCYDIGDWLVENTPLSKFCQWVDSKRRRNIKVKIHEYDCWNLDTTLAHIILPALIRFKEEETGGPLVDDVDVPEELQSTNAQEPATGNDWDSNSQLRWVWLLDELIWTFSQVHNDCDWEEQYYSGTCSWENNKFDSSNFKVDQVGYDAHQKRISNGLKLFGKYYQGLWN